MDNPNSIRGSLPLAFISLAGSFWVEPNPDIPIYNLLNSGLVNIVLGFSAIIILTLAYFMGLPSVNEFISSTVSAVVCTVIFIILLTISGPELSLAVLMLLFVFVAFLSAFIFKTVSRFLMNREKKIL